MSLKNAQQMTSMMKNWIQQDPQGAQNVLNQFIQRQMSQIIPQMMQSLMMAPQKSSNGVQSNVNSQTTAASKRRFKESER